MAACAGGREGSPGWRKPQAFVLPLPADGQAFRQTTQPAAWFEATIRHPAGACGQLARASWPVGQPVSTTVVAAGSGWPGLKNPSSVHHTSNACGTHTQ
jgi:hypothetical protein